MGAPFSVGIVGCGNIAPRYVQGCRLFDALDVVACADLVLPVAESFAAQYALRAMPVEALIMDPAIDVVLNLTVPAAHTAVSLAAITAGKHIYSEKPLAITREDGAAILSAAEAAGVRVGCAPDTFLGGGLQTCRKLIDEGAIGAPVAATAFMMSHGPESWHPNPHFFYATGAGPLFDMGPYYITALVHLLGPVHRVTGSARISFAERVATSEVRNGERIPVNVPTHSVGVLDFASGPIATLIMSFDVWRHELPRIEIYGSEGTLSVPDPNAFGGPVRLWRHDAPQWREVPLTHSDQVMRGIGLADMAHALRSGRTHRANGTLAFHALDVMHAIGDASDLGAHVVLASQCDQPAALPVDLPPRQLDD